jgi:hypothetical protein
MLLTVDGAYLTQGVQRADGTLPLVAGRDALLRVFLRGDQVNFFARACGWQILPGGVPQQTLEMPPGADSYPRCVARET